MSLEKTTELYASVLRQLLPEGVYDTAEKTYVADDVYAHAKVLAQADIDAHRLLQVLETIPVDLLADYEREYGLPMQCMVPGTQSVEERIDVLRWVRTNRNVLNRTYLEQLLAIFGVTLVDIIKYFPMQCTAQCNAPVNTEQLRYKVFLRFQYPMTADISCIIENYLPAYLRVDWVIDMPWGDWILNTEVTFTTNSIAHYTAFKTNQRDYYDSYADLDLTSAIVKSLSDVDMQQWQAVKDAIKQLSGVTSWTIDLVNGRVSYVKKTEVWEIQTAYWGVKTASSPYNACLFYSIINANWTYADPMYVLNSDGKSGVCKIKYIADPSNVISNGYLTLKSSTSEQLYIPFSTIAQKIISNTLSTDQGISLLAEAYRETVAKSLFNTDLAKQFVNRSDLLSQFELNKTLRT